MNSRRAVQIIRAKRFSSSSLLLGVHCCKEIGQVVGGRKAISLLLGARVVEVVLPRLRHPTENSSPARKMLTSG